MKRIVFTEDELSAMYTSLNCRAIELDDPDLDKEERAANQSAKEKVLRLRTRLRERTKK